MSLRDIAVVNGISEDAARSNLRYARNNLKRRIEKQHGKALGGSLPGTAAIPTLTAILQKDAALLVTGESAHKVLFAVGASLAAGATTAAAGAQVVAVLLGSTAPVVAAAAIATGVLIGGSPSSSAPFAQAGSISPQSAAGEPHCSAEEEGELHIEEEETSVAPSSRIVLSSTTRLAGETPTFTGPQALLAAGRVVLMGDEGVPLSHPDLNLADICIEAYEGEVLQASAYTDSEGNYTLALPDSGKEYRIEVAHNAFPQIGLQEYTLTLPASESEIEDFPIVDAIAPRCSVALLDSEGKAASLVMPAAAQLTVADATPCAIQWAIEAATGTGAFVQIDALGLAEG